MVNQVKFFQAAEFFEVEDVAFHETGFGDIFDVFEFSAGEIIVNGYVCA